MFEKATIRARWCDEMTAERCESTTDHAHIIIASPGSKGIIPHCRKVSLRMFFYDLDPEAIRKTKAFEKDSAKGQELIDGCFTEEQAYQLVRFLKLMDGIEIVVNCEAGVSRSPGVVLALRRHFGGDTEEVFKKALPNIHVTSVLTRVLRKTST